MFPLEKTMRVLRLSPGSIPAGMPGHVWDRVVDEGVLEKIPPENRREHLERIRALLAPGGVYEVHAENRRFAESKGGEDVAQLFSLNEFLDLLTSGFGSVRCFSVRAGEDSIREGISEFSERFMAECVQEAPGGKKILVLAEEAELLGWLERIREKGMQAAGVTFYPVQELVYQNRFRVHRIRGAAQIPWVLRVERPEIVLLTGTYEALWPGLAARKEIRLIRGVEELDCADSMKGPFPVSSIARVPLSKKMGLVWEGSFFVHHSLSHVNEEVALALDREKISLSLLPYEPPQFSEKEDRRLSPLPPLFMNFPSRVDLHIRHLWPPNWEATPEGEFVLMQPWEFGSIPISWMKNLHKVREVWAYTNFVRDTYIRSGVPENRVKVMSLGVNLDVFSPLGRKLELPTRGSFRFLYVGGLIGRKGFDVLLRAYLEEFGAQEDVCLVVRDFFYRSDLSQRVRDMSGKKDLPEILHVTAPLLPSQIPELYRACQAYVQPYRGEGFGLPILEAMACGLPVVVTGYGSALDFCHAGNAYLLPARLVLADEPRVDQLATVDRPFWAEVEVASLRKAMRHVFENRLEALHKGTLAAQEAAWGWTWRKTARRIEERCLSLKEERPRPWVMSQPSSTEAYVREYNQASLNLARWGEGKPSFEAMKADEKLASSPEAAVEQFKALLGLPGWEGEGHYGVARAALLQGERAEALGHLQSAVAACPFHALAWRDLARLAREMGLDEEASLASAEASKFFPKSLKIP